MFAFYVTLKAEKKHPPSQHQPKIHTSLSCTPFYLTIDVTHMNMNAIDLYHVVRFVVEPDSISKILRSNTADRYRILGNSKIFSKLLPPLRIINATAMMTTEFDVLAAYMHVETLAI